MSARYRNYLPSSHFVKVTLICFALAALVIGGVKLSRRAEVKQAARAEKEIQEAKDNGTLVAISTLAEKDTDADGVADWEEALWGTDPARADSDSDGTSDQQEIAAKKASVELASGTVADTGTLTETEAFSRELFASIAALKQSGNLTDQSIEDLARTISQNAGEKQTITATYRIEDISTIPDSAENSSRYHQALLAVLKKYDNSGIGSELAIIDEGLAASVDEDAGADDVFADLYPIADAYKDLAGDLAAISPVRTLASTHLALVNGAQGTGVSLGNIPQVSDNAIGGLIGVAQYQKESTTFDEAMLELQDYFIRSGIIR